MTENQFIDVLAEKLAKFKYDVDIYNFNDNCDTFEDGVNQVKEILINNNPAEIQGMIDDIESYREDCDSPAELQVINSLVQNIEAIASRDQKKTLKDVQKIAEEGKKDCKVKERENGKGM